MRSAANRSVKHALKAAFRWLDVQDVIARRELKDVIRPLPEDLPKPERLPFASFGLEDTFMVYEEE